MSSSPRTAPCVLVIENDVTCPPAFVGTWLEASRLSLRILRPHAGDPVPTFVPDDVDAVLPLGGSIGAYDDADAPWLVHERSLLADATRRGVPVLGICLGGQLLAAATGGRVEVSDVTEIGVSEVSRTMDGLADPVTGALLPVSGDTVPAAQWHLDRITQLPDGAVVLMTNDACPIQAFRIGESAYGLQMHPEVDAPLYAEWVVDSTEIVPRSAVTASQSEIDVREREEDLLRAWEPGIRAWGALVWKRALGLGSLSAP